jgi:hypothetical protein
MIFIEPGTLGSSTIGMGSPVEGSISVFSSTIGKLLLVNTCACTFKENTRPTKAHAKDLSILFYISGLKITPLVKRKQRYVITVNGGGRPMLFKTPGFEYNFVQPSLRERV